MIKIPIEHQVLYKEGKPEFVVLPYDQFQAWLSSDSTLPYVPESPNVPWDVLRPNLESKISMAKAWREYLGLSQDEVAGRMGITQSAVSQIEEAKRPRKKTLEKYAAALGISYEQLR